VLWLSTSSENLRFENTSRKEPTFPVSYISYGNKKALNEEGLIFGGRDIFRWTNRTFPVYNLLREFTLNYLENNNEYFYQ
jgi:hypothetical protein